ncbi:MAG: hypothetical protein NT085_02120 [candidate division SR1 bacterium]|nr:hypothetical protein [candidate division SR1 bacterium]
MFLEKLNIMNEKKELDNQDINKDSSLVGRNAFPKFELKNILDIKVPRITVKQIDDNMEIEKTHTFNVLLSYFNKAHGKNLSTENLLHSRSSFDAFIMFVMNCLLKRYLIINEDCETNFLLGLKRLRDKYNQNLRSIDIYYDIIVEKIFYPQGLTKQDPEVREQMYFFDQAYSLMKVAFKDNKRENGERYFEHLKGVMDIILRELPNPNLEKILIALLHDVQEDLPEYADAVRLIYGDKIADGVNALSKKPRENYLTEENFTKEDIHICGIFLKEKNSILENAATKIVDKYPDKSFMAEKKIKEKDLIPYMDPEQLHNYKTLIKKIQPFADKAKTLRNEDYFGHLDELEENERDVKFADRIHNLRDMDGLTREKAIRKVRETEKYFLAVAKKRNPTAYTLMIEAIQKNKERFKF